MVGIRKLDTPTIPRAVTAEKLSEQTSTSTSTSTPAPATSTQTTGQAAKTATATAKAVTAAAQAEALRDTTTTAPLGQTKDHTVAAAIVGEQAATNALDKQSAVQASHAGRAVAKNELTPEFKAAKQLGGEFASKVWRDKAPPELQAMATAIGPQVHTLATQTAASVLADPTAMANIGSVVSKLGKEGFTAALSTSTKNIADHFVKTVGVPAKNREAIKAALSGIEQLAPKIGGSVGAKLASTAKDLGPKILGEGAAASASAASTGAKALPLIGNIVSVGSTLLAGANLISQLTKSPRDVEKILKEGVNTLTQGIGVAFPWVALGGTLTDAAWSAKLGVSDDKKAAAGIAVTDNANVAASLPLLTDSAEILRAALHGAGKTDAAEKVGNLVATTKTMAKLDLGNPGERIKLLRKDEQEALVSLAHESKTELDIAGTQAPAGTRQESLKRLAGGFGALADTLLATMRLDRREAMPAPGSGGDDDAAKKQNQDLAVKRNELAGNLVKQLGDLGLVELLRAQEDRSAAPASAV